MCTDPGGCDAIDQLLRGLIWGYVLIAWMIFFAALRPWTSDLPTPIGVVLSAAASAVIVRVSVGVVGSSGSLRTALTITAIGLALVWIGRPAFTERRSAPPERPQDTEFTEGSSPTSSTH